MKSSAEAPDLYSSNFGMFLGDFDQLRGVRMGERTEQHGIHLGKCGGVSAAAYRQRAKRGS